MSVLRLLSCASRQARGSHAQTRAYTRKDVLLTLTRMHRMREREREREEAKNTGTECVFIRTLDPKYTNKERCRKGKGVRRGGKEGIKEEGLGRLRGAGRFLSLGVEDADWPSLGVWERPGLLHNGDSIQ